VQVHIWGCATMLSLQFLGNVMGYPVVFQGNLCLYPSKPVPIHKGMGSDRYGSWVGYNPWVSKPVWDRNTLKAIVDHLYVY
ncbi:hypothetical protein L208DRAFT_1268613, partial [Tricholoma matsutake]